MNKDQLIKASLSFRFGVAVTILTILALANILAAIFIIQNADSYASAINVAGSLRMQSYRISNEILLLGNNQINSDAKKTTLNNQQPASSQLNDRANEFIARLNSNLLHNVPDMGSSSDVQKAFSTFELEWENTMLPIIIKIQQLNTANSEFNSASKAYLEYEPDFVEHIDQYVLALQKSSENRIRLLGLIALFCVFCIVGVAYTVIYLLNATVIVPLNELVEVADKFRGGDFRAHSNNTSKDELGILGQTYNQMAESISLQYAQLEHNVHQKTQALMHSNQTLKFLYETSKKLAVSPNNIAISSILHGLKNITGVQHAMICFKDEAGTKSQWLCCCERNNKESFPFYILDLHQQVQLNSNILFPAITYQIKEGQNYFGFICVEPRKNHTLGQWQHQLIKNVSNQLAAAYSLKHQDAQDRLLILFEERATIARELHDSLAQSLSYLKIQNTRFKTLLQRNANQAVILNVSADMEEGLNAAYRHLRELLNTFRLKTKEASLEAALNATVKEFTSLTEIPVKLKYDLQNINLSPNEVIHVLQIIREAVSNAVKHAEASSIQISGKNTHDGKVQFSVIDNGKGFPKQLSTQHHYGLSIMQERTESLHGKLSIVPGPQSGTGIILIFTPQLSTTAKGRP